MYDKYIFDFDYTLFETTENVLVWSPYGTKSLNGRTYIEVTSPEFPNLELRRGETIDNESFIKFRRVDFDKAIPIEPVLDVYRNVSNKLILSARPHQVIEDIRRHLGPDTEFYGLGHSDVYRKLDTIKRYRMPLVYDDSRKLIAKLIEEGIDCVHVIHEGNTLTLKYHLQPESREYSESYIKTRTS